MDGSESALRKPVVINRAEWGLLMVLAAVQFTHILDFVIIMPLGPQAMRELKIDPEKFGLLVSVYGFAACVTSLLASIILDRFDRKKALVVLYAGFTISTFFCGIAPNYEILILGRILAGAAAGTICAPAWPALFLN